jgi:AraC-like DNA-binding protein
MCCDRKIPHIKLGPEQVGSDKYFDAWREFVRPIYHVDPLPGTTCKREGLEAWRLENLIFLNIWLSSQTFSHQARHAEESRYLSLQLCRDGGWKGITGETVLDVSPGEIHIFDFSRELHGITEASNIAGVIIPHSAVGYDKDRHSEHLMFPADSGVGGLLAQVFLSLHDQLPHIETDDAKVLARGFCEMLESIIRATHRNNPEMRQKHTAQHADIRSYIDRHMSDPDFGIDHVHREFGPARTSAPVDPGGTGDLAQYIDQRRIDRAFHHILTAASENCQAEEIAMRFGFRDPSRFNDLFRQRYGILPALAIRKHNEDEAEETFRPLPATARLVSADFTNWINAI